MMSWLLLSCGAQPAAPQPQPAAPQPKGPQPATATPLCERPGAQRDLEKLSACVSSAVSILDAEPREAEPIGDFVRRPLDGAHPAFERCGWLRDTDLSGVRFSKKTASWDHFDDGTASAHIELNLGCSGSNARASTTIELRMGEPTH